MRRRKYEKEREEKREKKEKYGIVNYGLPVLHNHLAYN